MTDATAMPAPQHTAMGRLLDVIERTGNKVPHPVLMFLYLIIGVIVLSTVLVLSLILGAYDYVWGAITKVFLYSDT